MSSKVYKTVVQDNGTITFYGSNRTIHIDPDKTPEWDTAPVDSFRYRGHRYYLDEFMCIESYMPDYMQEFDGYLTDSYFSGVAIKLTDDDTVKAFLFIS